MQKPVSVVLSGVGGYGEHSARLVLAAPEKYHLAGFIDPKADSSPHIAGLRARAPQFPTLEDFFANSKADLTVISAPIPYHEPQTALALRHGSNVLCEKPAAATPQEIRAMIAARDKTDRFVDIGYQWSHSDAILRLKKLALSGALGKPLRLRAMLHWPRNAAYYARAAWPGKKKDAKGNYILDSVASNATAHYLHNMFFVTGPAMDRSAFPVSLQAELYRANPIETFDTCMVRATLDNGAEVLYYASHAVRNEQNPPVFRYEFEKGEAIFPNADKLIEVRYADGRTEVLGNPFADDMYKLSWCADYARGIGDAPPCPPEAALPLTLAVCAMHRSVPDAAEFPRQVTDVREGGYTYVEGLNELIETCYEKAALPHELGILWAQAGRRVAVSPDDIFDD